MREARDYRVSPSVMLGLPWSAWGETDVMLAMCRRAVDAGSCPCGCGHDAVVSTDAATEGRWQPVVDECFARTALNEFQDDHKEDLPSGALVGVRLLPEGEDVVDPLSFTDDPEVAKARYEAKMAQLRGD